MNGAAEVDQWDGGVGWVAHPEEYLQRTSHAICGNDGVWLIDPIAGPGVEAIVDPLGQIEGVVVTLDRHRRDGETFASAHDVALHLSREPNEVADGFTCQIESLDRFSAATGFSVVQTVDLPGWREVALIDDTTKTLLVGDILGTAPYFSPRTEPLSVHPLLRLWPPRNALCDLSPERILVGHGPGVMEHGTEALHDALNNARRGIPRAWTNALTEFGRTILR